MAETFYITQFRTISDPHCDEKHEVLTGEGLNEINGTVFFQTSHGFQEANPIRLISVERAILKPHRDKGDLRTSLTLELKVSHDAAVHEAEWSLTQSGDKPIPNAYIKEICEDLCVALRTKHGLPRFNRRWEHLTTTPVQEIPSENLLIPLV